MQPHDTSFVSSTNIDSSLFNNKVNLSDEEEIRKLENEINVLNKICLELNPYQKIPQKVQDQLQTFNILNFNDPFKITNTLLVLLDDAHEKLDKLKNKESLF